MWTLAPHQTTSLTELIDDRAEDCLLTNTELHAIRNACAGLQRNAVDEWLRRKYPDVLLLLNSFFEIPDEGIQVDSGCRITSREVRRQALTGLGRSGYRTVTAKAAATRLATARTTDGLRKMLNRLFPDGDVPPGLRSWTGRIAARAWGETGNIKSMVVTFSNWLAKKAPLPK
ncbi:hypothetical protein ACFL6C_13455, partial [Myxococcota bacterium]